MTHTTNETSMTTMNAIITADDEAKTLSLGEVPKPIPGPGEVLLAVHATAVNRADLVQRAGKYPPPPGASHILGLEAAGVVEALGDGVEGVELGQRACALLTGGGYAEYVTVPASLLMDIPAGMSMSEAAALPEVYFTAWVNLFMEANIQHGEAALIHAGASGVGTAAIQLCKAMGVPVWATASGQKLEFLRELGVEDAFDRREQDFVSEIKAATGGRGADVILDPVGADYLERNIKALARRGRMVSIGLLSGREATLPMGPVLVKRLKVIGSVLRSRSVEEKELIAEDLRARAWGRFETGELKPIIERTFPLAQAQEAHELLASNTTIGKIVLEVR